MSAEQVAAYYSGLYYALIALAWYAGLLMGLRIAERKKKDEDG